MAASAETITANTAPYLSEFFELPLTEIESNLNVSHTTANSNQIVVLVSNVQLKKLIGELEPQRDEIGKDAELFRIAFFDLLLDKLHLSGIYDAVVSEYLSADMPSAWWDPMHPFDVEDCSDGSYACISLQYPENTQNPEDHLEEYTLRNGDTNVTVDRYELTQRSLYVINTYGNKDYFTSAYEELTALNTAQTTENTTEITTTTTTATTTTDKTATTTDITNTAPYLSEFFELSLTEIESNLNVSHTTANSNQIVVLVSNVQLKKLIGELEPQRDEIGKDAELFRIAFFDLLLDKLHLSGIYDAVVSEYLSADMPSAWWDPMHPFDVEDCSDGSYACISLQYPENTQNPEDHLEEYTLRNGDTNVTVDRYELTQRSLYVINTYGNKDYFTSAYEELTALNTAQTTENTTEITTTTMTTTTTTDKTATTTDETNTNLPQTGNNSVNKLLIAIAALMLAATGAGAVYYSGILRRTEDDK